MKGVSMFPGSQWNWGSDICWQGYISVQAVGGGALDLVPPHFWTFLKSAPPLRILGCHWPPHFLAGSGGAVPSHLKNPKYTPVIEGGGGGFFCF